jgi:hypothetical protein
MVATAFAHSCDRCGAFFNCCCAHSSGVGTESAGAESADSSCPCSICPRACRPPAPVRRRTLWARRPAATRRWCDPRPSPAPAVALFGALVAPCSSSPASHHLLSSFGLPHPPVAAPMHRPGVVSVPRAPVPSGGVARVRSPGAVDAAGELLHPAGPPAVTCRSEVASRVRRPSESPRQTPRGRLRRRSRRHHSPTLLPEAPSQPGSLARSTIRARIAAGSTG